MAIVNSVQVHRHNRVYDLKFVVKDSRFVIVREVRYRGRCLPKDEVDEFKADHQLMLGLFKKWKAAQSTQAGWRSA